MSFDAGSAIGHLLLDSSDWVKGMGGMTGSIVKGNLIASGFQKVISGVVDTLKKGVDQFLESEKVSTQLSQTLKSTGYAAGLTKKEIIDMAAALQQTTRFEDDAIIGAQNLLLTFTKIGKDVFPQATEIVLDMSQALGQDLKSSAIQVGKALQDPILGVTALRRVGVNFNEAQQEVIKNLVKTGRQAEAQAMILKELQTEFGGSAKAARDNFGGALANLENNTGDFYESIGKVVAIVGRDFVENMSKGVKSINEFLESEEGFKTISEIVSSVSAGFEVAKTIFEDFGKISKDLYDKYVPGIQTSLEKLFGKSKESSLGFNILAGVTKTVGTGFAITASIVAGFIKNLVNLVNLGKESAGVLIELGKALANPTDSKGWERFDQQVKKTQTSFKTFTDGLFTSSADTIKTVTSEFAKFGADMQIDAEKFNQIWTAAYDKTKAKLIENKQKEADALKALNQQETQDFAAELAKQLEEEEKLTKEKEELAKKWVEIAYKAEEETTAGKLKHLNEQYEAFKRAGIDQIELEKWKAGEIKKINDEAADEQQRKFQEDWNKITGIASSAISQIGNIFDQHYNNQLTAEDNDYQTKKAYIEKNVTDEDEKNKQLEALELEHKKKSGAIKKQQFEANKAGAIAMAIIDTANSVLKTFFQFGGWPLGVIPAAIMAGIGAVQIGMIASQPVPAFEKGGVGSPGLALVGEAGPELINLGKTSRVIPAQETASILNRGNGVNVNNNFYGDINSDVDIDRSMQLAGASYRSLLRSS